ncbi:MAG: adenine phosphoribosyltransferase [Candidatus Saccharimonadales bacterium]
MTDYRKYIQTIEDFPKPGIRFYDISPLLGSGTVFASAIADMSKPLRDQVNKIVGFDARGFVFGAAMALELGVGFVMLRKPGKLPGTIESVNYGLEYGTNTLEMQTDAIGSGDRVVLVDDVIATGGTARAGIELVRRVGGEVVAFSALLDLPALGGSQSISKLNVPVHSLLRISNEG